MPPSTTTPADAGAPRVEIARIANGQRTWRIVAIAADTSEAALDAAQDLAVRKDGELAARYDHPPT